jgi:hypothetical protein
MQHCTLFQTEDIQVIVGDASRNGFGGQQYCGLWSLTSKHRQFNAFGNSYAGLLPGEIRGKGPVLELVNETSCALVRAADDERPVDVRAEYMVRSPNYVDHTLTFTDREDVRNGRDFREVSWCCYMNCPEDSRLNFISNGQWQRYASPSHGTGSSLAPSYVPDHALEVWPAVDGKRPFHWDRSEHRFDQPFYYGRLGKMVMILVFDTPNWLRFFCSPSGGGHSLLPDQTCPAWDFEWVIPHAAYRVGKEYSLRVRLVYKLYESDEDVLAEVEKAQEELGFERVG